jgi:hypothetical protein
MAAIAIADYFDISGVDGSCRFPHGLVEQPVADRRETCVSVSDYGFNEENRMLASWARPFDNDRVGLYLTGKDPHSRRLHRNLVV